MNVELLTNLAKFLNENPDIITPSQVKKVMKSGVDEAYAYSLLLSEYTGYKYDYSNIVTKLDEKEFTSNPYYINVKDIESKYKGWELKYSTYKPYELIVIDDFDDNGNPKLGYFTKPFKYPAIYQNKRLWMSITPNEINTMKKGIANAHGDVLVAGVGMLYIVYMMSLKEEVKSITVIDVDQDVIDLAQNVLLPQFELKDKIKFIRTDALYYINNLDAKFDYIYIDIWHDVSDGLPLYIKFKNMEKNHPNIQFDYWIENTLKWYL